MLEFGNNQQMFHNIIILYTGIWNGIIVFTIWCKSYFQDVTFFFHFISDWVLSALDKGDKAIEGFNSTVNPDFCGTYNGTKSIRDLLKCIIIKRWSHYFDTEKWPVFNTLILKKGRHLIFLYVFASYHISLWLVHELMANGQQYITWSDCHPVRWRRYASPILNVSATITCNRWCNRSQHRHYGGTYHSRRKWVNMQCNQIPGFPTYGHMKLVNRNFSILTRVM